MIFNSLGFPLTDKCTAECKMCAIAKRLDINEINVRLLNADGASWIKKMKDKSTIEYRILNLYAYK